jgi:pimeloyl-ACP methyl ester carboxylesterase
MKKQVSLTKAKMFLPMSVILMLCMAFMNKPANAQATKPVKNIVLVHGAFADAIQNPLTSLEDDVAATNNAINKYDDSVILVGHSWGGTVITQAGLHPKVARLVYVAAWQPDIGESTLDLAQSEPMAAENGVMLPDENGLIYYSKEKFHQGFAADLSKEKADFLYDSQGAISAKAFSAKVTQAAWRTKPSYGIIATEDKSLNPVIERKTYKRAGSIVTEIKASHVVFVSQPQKVADVIEAAAKGAK